MLHERLFKIKGNGLQRSCGVSGDSTESSAGNPPAAGRRRMPARSAAAALRWRRQQRRAPASQNTVKYLAYAWPLRLVLPLAFHWSLLGLVFLFSVYLFAGCGPNPSAQSHRSLHDGTGCFPAHCSSMAGAGSGDAGASAHLGRRKRKELFCNRINRFLSKAPGVTWPSPEPFGQHRTRNGAGLPAPGAGVPACRHAAGPYPSQRICGAIKSDNPSGLWYISGHDYFITRSISVGS